MNRRAFLSLSAISPLAHLLPAFGQTIQALGRPQPRELKADVAIIGGGVGGVACAIAAARNGTEGDADRRVRLDRRATHVARRTAGRAPVDRGTRQHEDLPVVPPEGPRLLRPQLSAHRRREEERRNSNPGNGSVSKLCHEPRVALAVLLEMLAPHITAGRITLLQPYLLRDARTEQRSSLSGSPHSQTTPISARLYSRRLTSSTRPRPATCY